MLCLINSILLLKLLPLFQKVGIRNVVVCQWLEPVGHSSLVHAQTIVKDGIPLSLVHGSFVLENESGQVEATDRDRCGHTVKYEFLLSHGILLCFRCFVLFDSTIDFPITNLFSHVLEYNGCFIRRSWSHLHDSAKHDTFVSCTHISTDNSDHWHHSHDNSCWGAQHTVHTVVQSGRVQLQD